MEPLQFTRFAVPVTGTGAKQSLCVADLWSQMADSPAPKANEDKKISVTICWAGPSPPPMKLKLLLAEEHLKMPIGEVLLRPVMAQFKKLGADTTIKGSYSIMTLNGDLVPLEDPTSKAVTSDGATLMVVAEATIQPGRARPVPVQAAQREWQPGFCHTARFIR